MRLFNRIPSWFLVLSLGFLAITAKGRLRADPSDDFSYSLAIAPVSHSFRMMSESGIEQVLRDHLKGVPAQHVPKLARHLRNLCREHRFDPAFILSLIEVESRFRTEVVSPAGAIGLMQLMPATANVVAKWNGTGPISADDLKNPFTNLTLGVSYLAFLRDKYRADSPYFHIAAYNIGPSRLDQLRKRENFRPVSTKKYYKAIREGSTRLRHYRARQEGPKKRHPWREAHETQVAMNGI